MGAADGRCRRSLAGIRRKPGVIYAALTPNLQGFERALMAGADEVAVFASASEGFSQKNINCSVADSLQRFQPVLQAAPRRDDPGARLCLLRHRLPL
jgi:hydroxymethylglutaryl-CoA lyase